MGINRNASRRANNALAKLDQLWDHLPASTIMDVARLLGVTVNATGLSREVVRKEIRHVVGVGTFPDRLNRFANYVEQLEGILAENDE